RPFPSSLIKRDVTRRMVPTSLCILHSAQPLNDGDVVYRIVTQVVDFDPGLVWIWIIIKRHVKTNL
ncbi:hypothetical protein, partial [Paenibacillus melissococcoides]|uniref:hypothetical protein n=1 Tax=Paenibacillus melissococcoides TaxID=2912268 RepID=UPI0021C334DF